MKKSKKKLRRKIINNEKATNDKNKLGQTD